MENFDVFSRRNFYVFSRHTFQKISTQVGANVPPGRSQGGGGGINFSRGGGGGGCDVPCPACMKKSEIFY